jgi:hypothetical protein
LLIKNEAVMINGKETPFIIKEFDHYFCGYVKIEKTNIN